MGEEGVSRTARTWVRGDGIVQSVLLPGVVETLADRVYYAGPATAEIFTAAALPVESMLSRAIANFFLGLNKPLIPTRLFNDEAEAVAWLGTQG